MPVPAVITQADLITIMELTRTMLALAETGEWDDLIRLESTRSAMLKQYFSTLGAAGRAEAGDAALMHELRTLNDRILAIGKARRQQLVSGLSDSNRQRRAAAHYRQTRVS